MAETEDDIPDAGLNFATRPRLLSWNQKQLRALAREGEERGFIDLTTADLTNAVSQNIPQNWLLEGKCWLRWTFGTEVYHLDPDRYLDLRDWSDPQLERLLQQLRDGEVLVEAVNDKEIAAAKSVNALDVSGLNSSKASQKRYRATDRLKERLIQTIGTCIAPPQTIASEYVLHINLLWAVISTTRKTLLISSLDCIILSALADLFPPRNSGRSAISSVLPQSHRPSKLRPRASKSLQLAIQS
jgi:hypothetical protein